MNNISVNDKISVNKRLIHNIIHTRDIPYWIGYNSKIIGVQNNTNTKMYLIKLNKYELSFK